MSNNTMNSIPSANNDITYYASIVTGVLFAMSEIMPFLPTDCNGLLQFVINMIKKCGNNIIQEENTLKEIKVNLDELKELNKKLDQIILEIKKNNGKLITPTSVDNKKIIKKITKNEDNQESKENKIELKTII